MTDRGRQHPGLDAGPGDAVLPVTEWDTAEASEAALAESEERFRLAMDTSAVAMNISGPDGHFQRVNEAMCRLFDRDAADLLRCTWQELTYPEDLSADEALAAEIVAGQRDHYRMLKRYVRRDGTIIWGDLTVSCAWSDDGTFDYAIAQIVDVTELKEALLERERSDELLRRLMDTAPVGMGVTTLDGSFVRVNQAMADFLGRPIDELLSMRWQDVSSPDVVPEELLRVDEVLSGRRESYQLIRPFPMPDGSTRKGLLSVTCTRSDEGAPQLLVGQIVDVTPQESARATLEATLNSLLDPHVVFAPVLDDSGGVVDLIHVSVNEAACRFMGRTREELLGRRASEMGEPGMFAAALTLSQAALATGGLSRDDVALAGDDAGEGRWFDLRAVRVGDTVSHTWREVTERHQAAADLARREARFRLIADNATDVIIRSDLSSGIEWVSPSVTEVLGWLPEQLNGKCVGDFMHPDDLADVDRRQQEIIRAGGDDGRVTARFATADGQWRWMSDHGRLVRDADGNPVAGIDALRDVHAEQEALSALRLHEQQLRGVIDSLIDPWVLLKAVRDSAGGIVDFVYVDANEAACQYNRVTRDELIGTRLLSLLPEHSSTGIFDKYALVVETGTPLADDDEPFINPHDGVERRFDNRAVKVGDGISLTWRDVTDRFEARQSLRRDAEQDLLTGVANRRQFDRRLEEMIARTPRTGTEMAILYCDVDRFKEANDALGHAGGDRILIAVAQGIRRAIREGDVVARLGGDEFVIILDGVRGAAEAEAVAVKIARAVAVPITVSATRVEPRLSIGVALVGRDEDPQAGLARADAAMYRAKRAGRDRIIVAES